MQNDQAILWNGPAGRVWVEAQETLDAMLAPFGDALAAAARGRVLDVGCGTGALTLAALRGGARECTGVDISAPMIGRAQERAAREGASARFVCADAESHEFVPGSFDAIVSRFGVMFFGHPEAAFANLRRAAAPGAVLRFAAWRSAAENPFMTAAERAAGPLLPELPARRADGPGQFAFADAQRVSAILTLAGWADVAIRRWDVECRFPAAALEVYATKMGPVGMALGQLAEPRRTAVATAVRGAFAEFVRGDEVRFAAACWDVEARAV